MQQFHRNIIVNFNKIYYLCYKDFFEQINNMTMKQIELNNIFEFLRKIRINKINDRETKIGLINIHMELYKKVQEFDEYIKELQKKYFEGKESELEAYNQQVAQMQTADPEKRDELEAALDPEIKKLVIEFNSLINARLDQEIPIELEKVDKQKFIEALIDLDIEFTCDDLIVLKDLYK